MADVDVFNGDADGICALQQLRLADPRPTRLITGIKRDIALLARVEAGAGDRVTVLDISLDKNRTALLRLLNQGAEVRYFDHHHPGEIPQHPNLEVHIETLPDKGTSLLVDEWLGGAYRAWAVVGSFGDNFDAAAARAAEPLGLADSDLAQLRELGILLNYNGYGAAEADLHCHPAELYRRLSPYADPLVFIERDPSFKELQRGYREDMAQAEQIRPLLEDAGHRAYLLPDAPWARRVSGVFANALAQAAPEQAHALLTRQPNGNLVVSVRAPLASPEGADLLCRGFETGGGRKAAAGINRLPEQQLDAFLEAFVAAFQFENPG